MTAEEWKQELIEKTRRVVSGYEEIQAHMDSLDSLEGEYDEDEVFAFVKVTIVEMLIKIEKLQEQD